MKPTIQNGEIHEALVKLDQWVQRADWKAYDPFDGGSTPLAPVLTLNLPLLKQVLLHVVRRFPFNLRPLLGIKPHTSTKAMGFFAQGYLRLFQTYEQPEYLDRMRFCFQWLLDNASRGYHGYCWGNSFGGQTRGGYIIKGTPTIVWTGLIAHSFLDAYEAFGEERYAEVARSACEVILHDLGWMKREDGICLQYYPNANNVIHNSNMIGAGLLARVGAMTSNDRYRQIASDAVRFTVKHQTPEGAWAYGVGKKWGWIDSFHTGYVLEALEYYVRACGGQECERVLRKGYNYYLETFFGPDGTPRYYHNKTRPLDIQCASHGIQACVNLRQLDPRSVDLARLVAQWTIRHMQDPTGYFYYRKYPLVTNKTPTLHWAEATMFAALALLDQCLNTSPKAVGPGHAASVART